MPLPAPHRPTSLDYQPLPWLGRGGARRAAGTWSRWERIAAELEHTTPSSAVDLGCNTGFFCIALAQRGVHALGIDRDAPALAVARLAATRAGASARARFVQRDLGAAGALDDEREVTLCLSVWHHIVADHELHRATTVLADAWRRTRRVMFFESGGAEMPSDFGLPATGANPNEWLADYLAEVCVGGRVAAAGDHAAFDPLGRPATRRLFRVTR